MSQPPAYVTHFAPETPDRGIAALTLCGKPWGSVIDADRPATCPACRAAHARAGWTFPLPPVVLGV